MTERVFAYGSNMHLADLRRWMDERGFSRGQVLNAEPARILDYQLVWNYFSPARQGGAANVEPAPGQELHGVALEVNGPGLSAIDQKEGHPGRYRRGPKPVEAWTYTGIPRAVWLYRVTPAFLRPAGVPPTPDYLRLLVEGGRQLGVDRAYLDRVVEGVPQ